MTPEDTAFAFESAALGQALAALIGIGLVGLYLRFEWALSKPARERRQANLQGDRLIEAIGGVGDSVVRRHILHQWRRDWRRNTMRAKWGTRERIH